jgi:protein required for attachment to host cells
MNNHVKRTWILVAHRAGASIYESRGPGSAITGIATLENPSGRLKIGDVDSDRPGRAFDRVGGGRHAMSVEDSPLDRIELAFVTELVERLERGRNEHAFERLVLVAPPKMLGRLKAALSAPLSALLLGAASKDLAHTDARALRNHLSALPLF